MQFALMLLLIPTYSKSEASANRRSPSMERMPLASDVASNLTSCALLGTCIPHVGQHSNLQTAQRLLQSLGLKFLLRPKDSLEPGNVLNRVLALGVPEAGSRSASAWVHRTFPLVVARPAHGQHTEESHVKQYVHAITLLVQYYDISCILDTDQTRQGVAKALLENSLRVQRLPSPLSRVKLVLSHIFTRELGPTLLDRIDFLLDYSPLFNVRAGLVPRAFAQKQLVRPYANLPLASFEKEASKAASTVDAAVVEILRSKPFVLACGSNRRDFSGAILAAQRTGVRLVVADKNAEALRLQFARSPMLRFTSVSGPHFNALLAHALFVVVPAALPQPTPVGIGTLSRVRMARKIAVVTNNTGTNNMITHGFDGFLVPDPSNSSSAGVASYEAIFRLLASDKERVGLERNIDVERYTDEVAGAAMAGIARCIAAEGLSSWQLHHVTDCAQCRYSWCSEDSWAVNSADVGVRGQYSDVGPDLASLGCERLAEAATIQVVRNSINARVYVARACVSNGAGTARWYPP